MKLSSQLPILSMNAVGFCVTDTFSAAHVRRPPVAHWLPSCRPFITHSSAVWAGPLPGLCPKDKPKDKPKNKPKDMPKDMPMPANPDSGKSGEPDSGRAPNAIDLREQFAVG